MLRESHTNTSWDRGDVQASSSETLGRIGFTVSTVTAIPSKSSHRTPWAKRIVTGFFFLGSRDSDSFAEAAGWRGVPSHIPCRSQDRAGELFGGLRHHLPVHRALKAA